MDIIPHGGGGAMAKIKKELDIEKIIQRAVEEGIKAGYKQAERAPLDAYRTTERRLYALPTLIKKVQDAREKLQELEQYGLHERSRDIIRFRRSGQRRSNEEILEALIMDIKASIAADETEIETLKKALKQIENDTYYLAVKGKYLDGLSDDEIAQAISCDPSTVRRNRGRLVRVLAVWLYGAEAV
jgi:DNA-directed RNA polymerase specialized sigma24 family protein